MLRTGIPVSQLEREGESVLATLFKILNDELEPDEDEPTSTLHRPPATNVAQLAARNGQKLVDPFAEFGGA